MKYDNWIYELTKLNVEDYNELRKNILIYDDYISEEEACRALYEEERLGYHFINPLITSGIKDKGCGN
jgi:hypothetical protein